MIGQRRVRTRLIINRATMDIIGGDYVQAEENKNKGGK
jgi:hypothetical protein